ncbi:MAG: Ig-like domain-containing protein [Flavobacteriaceae bacterium]|nr:Ig-like domain-containing protein [Flavobacteriaceae bacterium]
MSKFRIYFFSFLIVFCGIFLPNCAKKGFISGGPQDTIPPVMLGSNPKNYSTNFDKDEIKIDFDEFVKIKDLNKNLIVSPPFDQMPDITPMGSARRTITIKLKDTLKPNTTYSFNFGDAIIDNNEGNVLKQFKYVFSTGSYIDSLTLSGTISSANKLKSDNFVNVMLYDAKTFKDSTIYKEKPLYVTNTLDSLTTFTIENIREGQYYLVALKDKNNNYKFDPHQDKIGFIKEPITIPSEKEYHINLFKSEEKFEANRPSQISENKWYVPFVGNAHDVDIVVKKNDSLIKSTYTRLQQKDSLQLWFPKIKADSLHVLVKQGDFKKQFTVRPRPKMKAIDTLAVSGSGGLLNFINDFSITTSTPYAKINSKLVTVTNKDSLKIPFDIVEDKVNQKLSFTFEKKENEKYTINLLPGAITDFFGKPNDTLNYKLNTNQFSDNGNLIVNLQGVKRFPIIVEIINEKEEVIASKISTKETRIEFNLLPPRKYFIKVIYDDNKNGKWDPGYYWDRRQAEETFFYPEEIDVRANWDINQEVILE